MSVRNCFLASCCWLIVGLASVAQAEIVVNFDDASKWTADPTVGNLSSYATGHQYLDSGLLFTGGPAQQQSGSNAGGVPTALGTYSWLLEKNANVAWTATYQNVQPTDSVVTGFAFDVRRWSSNPPPSYSVELSLDGGASFTNVGTINNAFLGNSSNWTSFSSTFAMPEAVTDGELVVSVSSNTNGERILIDNFRLTAVPEPTSALMFAVGCALVCRRRR